MRILLLIISLLLCSVAEARPTRFVQKFYAGNNTVIWSPTPLDPPNIVTSYNDWLAWKDYRVAQFQKEHPINRATKYYFSTSGNNANPCTEALPCETRTKADTFDAVNTALLFKRGDRWEECVQITLAANDMTVGAYGTGDKPYFSCFTQKINAGSSWSVVSGNTYSISNATDNVGWVRNADDPLGDSLGSWTQATTSSLNDTNITFPAWFRDDAANLLYVNLGSATSPSTLNIEFSINNRLSGVSTGFTGCRVDSQYFDGFSLDRTSPNHNAGYGIYFTGTGDESFLGTNSEAYYTSAHSIGALNGGSTGGHSMWIGNSAGYPMHNGAGSETIFNAASINSHESWFIENVAKYGATRIGNWQPAALKVDSEAIYSHTSSGNAGLTVTYGNTLPDSVNPVADLGRLGNCIPISASSQLEDVRCFIVANEQIHAPKSGGANYVVGLAGYQIYMNNRYAISPRPTGTLALTNFQPFYTFLIQNHYKIDYSTYGTGARSFYNTTSSDNRPYMWHNFIELLDTSGTGITTFGIDFDNRGGPGDFSPNAEAYNNVISNDHNSTFAGYHFGLNNDPVLMKANAIYKLTDTASGNPSGYGDTDFVTLNSIPVIDNYYAELENTGTSDIPFQLSHDINGNRRSGIDIGPVEQSASGLTYNYPDLAEDASLAATANDAVIFHNAFSDKLYRFGFAVTNAFANQIIYEEGGLTNGVVAVVKDDGNVEFAVWISSAIVETFTIPIELNHYYEFELYVDPTVGVYLEQGGNDYLGTGVVRTVGSHTDGAALKTIEGDIHPDYLGYGDGDNVIITLFEIRMPTTDPVDYGLNLSGETLTRTNNSDSSAATKTASGVIIIH